MKHIYSMKLVHGVNEWTIGWSIGHCAILRVAGDDGHKFMLLAKLQKEAD